MKILLLILLLVICGCSSMKNDEIIAEVKKCKEADMRPAVMKGWSGRVREVICLPEEKP